VLYLALGVGGLVAGAATPRTATVLA
jgi:hypothetical protein